MDLDADMHMYMVMDMEMVMRIDMDKDVASFGLELKVLAFSGGFKLYAAALNEMLLNGEDPMNGKALIQKLFKLSIQVVIFIFNIFFTINCITPIL